MTSASLKQVTKSVLMKMHNNKILGKYDDVIHNFTVVGTGTKVRPEKALEKKSRPMI